MAEIAVGTRFLWSLGQGDGRSLLSYVSKAIVDFVEYLQVDQKCHETLHNLGQSLEEENKKQASS